MTIFVCIFAVINLIINSINYWVGTDKVKFIEACHDLAVAQLKDKDKANWVRWYFGVNSK